MVSQVTLCIVIPIKIYFLIFSPLSLFSPYPTPAEGSLLGFVFNESNHLKD